MTLIPDFCASLLLKPGNFIYYLLIASIGTISLDMLGFFCMSSLAADVYLFKISIYSTLLEEVGLNKRQYFFTQQVNYVKLLTIDFGNSLVYDEVIDSI